MRLALHLSLGFLVYILRLEGVKPMLLEFYGALGMDEDAAQAHMDRLLDKTFLVTAISCIMRISLGMEPVMSLKLSMSLPNPHLNQGISK